MVNTKKIMGITGIVCAVLGGAAWFYQLHIPAFVLWGIAAYLVLKLNKRQKNR
ncbi:MAG: hypothetical protein R3321_13610 [Nitrososphaeraceae archaeon]|nr:hypothetical protein [Nitrososphaeraceae archaeon]